MNKKQVLELSNGIKYKVRKNGRITLCIGLGKKQEFIKCTPLSDKYKLQPLDEEFEACGINFLEVEKEIKEVTDITNESKNKWIKGIFKCICKQ